MTSTITNDVELVPMAGIGVGRDGVLRTLLGSCIGVVLYEKRMKLAGLAHVVMPDSMGRNNALGKYADTAIPEMIRRMSRVAGIQRLELVAKIAGGANMFAQVSPVTVKSIGEQNRNAVEKVLNSLNIPIVARHVGGTSGRNLFVQVSTGTTQIQIVGQPVIEI